ncbi:MAG: ABC transporter substrate-binding protein [Armatimonadetes bacterium]|nr:ABC transporter substrate-binding protein [Armatimonadota bacterium]
MRWTPGWRRAVVLAVAVAVALAAVAGVEAQRPQRELRMSYVSDVQNFDPAHFATDDYVAMNVFSGLVRYKTHALAVEPDLAGRWEVSKDGKVYTFYLRQNAEWQKGYGKITAQDIKFHFDRLKNPATRSRYRTVLDILERTDVVDDYTVRMTLKGPYSDFLPAILAWRPGWVVGKKIVDELGTRLSLEPVASGAYEVVSRRPRQEIVFRAHEKYFRGAPQIKNARFIVIPNENTAALALQKDEINLMIVRGVQAYLSLRADPNIGMVVTPVAGWRGLVFNVTRKPLDDVRVRRALHHAIDRKSLLQDVLHSFGTLDGTGSPIPPLVWGHIGDVPKFDYNPEQARRMIQEAGATGARLRLVFRPIGDDPAVVTVLQQMFRRAGIEVVLEQLEDAAYQRRRSSGDYDMLLEGPTRVAPDQFLTWMEGREYPGGANSSGYNGADDLIARQRVEVDLGKRRLLLAEIQKKIAGDVPLVQLWRPFYVVASRKYVKNDVPNYRFWITSWEHMKIE